MRLCKDCKHYGESQTIEKGNRNLSENAGRFNTSHGSVFAEFLISTSSHCLRNIDLVTGRQRALDCQKERYGSEIGGCGIIGTYFKAKEESE